jgi:hypothetical protein
VDVVTPLTPAGQALLDYFAASEAGMLGLTSGRFSSAWATAKVTEALPAIELQAADRALAELRREVEGLTLWSVSDRANSGWVKRAAVLALIDKAAKPEEGA